MAHGAGDEDAHMEPLVDLGDDQSVGGPERRPSVRGSVHSDSLLAPDADFMTDDRSSAASGLDVADRLTYLEQRMQMQEDEIQLLKMALADVLKRLNLSEELQTCAAAAGAGKRAGGKARPVSLALPSRPAALKKSCTVPSSGAGRNYSPTPSSSSLRSPPGGVKDSPSKTKVRTSSSSSTASASKKPEPESVKPKEAAAAATPGTRRVTHCKDLSEPPRKRTGSSEVSKSVATVTANTRPPVPDSGPTPTARAKTGNANDAKTKKKKKSNPTFTLNLQKTSTSLNTNTNTTNNNTTNTTHDTNTYYSPVKSPSQYFQICY